ncbi:NnrS family protein [Rheinheimera sp.]|uniref:NnrS family protein n=1 Tax=Rheinheimera sp. TaxID=1869214 RepID=UPI00307CF16B
MLPQNIEPNPASSAIPAVLALAFRPFFLLAGLWALLAIGLWLGQLSGWWPGQLLLPATLWHSHEMLFGFGALVAAGFLLTAAQNWTGVPGLKGGKLALLCLIWLSARLTPFVAPSQGIWLLIALQSLWWLGVIAALGRQLWLAKSRNNYQFLPLLLAMACLNAAVLWLSQSQHLALASHLSHSMILLFCLLMGLVGGRVIPFFTARATQTEQVRTARLDPLLLWVSLPGTALFISSGFFQPLCSPGWLMALAGLLHLVRLGCWFTPGLLRQPLLWSLHASYLAMALGLLLMGIALLTGWLNFKDMLHLVAIGAMAAMMLAMMARVSLGHTGRPLATRPVMAWSFAALLLAGLCRSLASALSAPHLWWQLSAALWLAAFLIFTRVYWPILTSRRLDGRAG